MPVGQSGEPRAVPAPTRSRVVNPPVRTSPRLEDIASDDSAEFEPHEDRGRPWIAIAVVAVGVLLGGTLGGLAVAGVGPFEPQAARFAFDPGDYGEAPLPLLPDRVGASSVLLGDANTSHGPENLADDDRLTAWRSLPDPGDDVFLDFRFERPVWVTDVEFAVGDQSDRGAFEALARPARVTVTFDEANSVVVVLEDVAGVQAVALPTPILTGQVRVHIDDAYGDAAAGIAVAEIRFDGHRATDTDQARWSEVYG